MLFLLYTVHRWLSLLYRRYSSYSVGQAFNSVPEACYID